MKSKQPESGDDLNSLYEARKRSVRTPGAIKRRILVHQEPVSYRPWINGLGGIAAAASLIILFSLMNVQLWPKPETTAGVEVQTREIHTLASKNEFSRESINNRYSEHYQKYLAQQALLAQHHSQPARLIMKDGDWELETCDEALLSVSSELVDALMNINKIDSMLEAGDSVNVLYAKNGIILGIEASKQPMQC